MEPMSYEPRIVLSTGSHRAVYQPNNSRVIIESSNKDALGTVCWTEILVISTVYDKNDRKLMAIFDLMTKGER